MTLKALYQSVTHDTLTHQRTIAAQLGRESKTRQRLVRLYVEGLSDRQVAARTRRSYGAARSMLRLTMMALYRRIHRVPRYWRTGRARPKAAARESARHFDGIRQAPPDFMRVDTRSLVKQAEAAAARKPPEKAAGDPTPKPKPPARARRKR